MIVEFPSLDRKLQLPRSLMREAFREFDLPGKGELNVGQTGALIKELRRRRDEAQQQEARMGARMGAQQDARMGAQQDARMDAHYDARMGAQNDARMGSDGMRSRPCGAEGAGGKAPDGHGRDGDEGGGSTSGVVSGITSGVVSGAAHVSASLDCVRNRAPTVKVGPSLTSVQMGIAEKAKLQREQRISSGPSAAKTRDGAVGRRGAVQL